MSGGKRPYSTTVAGSYTTRTGFNYDSAPSITNVADAQFASRTGQSVPRPKPQGWLPPTSYSMSEVSNQRASGTIIQTHKTVSNNNWIRSGRGLGVSGVTALVNSDLVALGISSESAPSDLGNRSLINARTKLKSQDINLAQAFGERAQTARLVATNLTRIAKSYRALRRGRIREAARILGVQHPDRHVRSIPRLWLEWQYGWKPLLSDIHGAVSALDAQPRDKWLVTVKGKSSARYKGTRLSVVGITLDNRKTIYDISHVAYTRIDAMPANAALITAAQLGFTNPVSLAWEFIPFSFVVDWAWPLGEYFGQMDALAGWEIKGCSTTVFSKARWEWHGMSNQSGDYTMSSDWRASRRMVKLDRSASSSVPFPMLPSIKDPFSQAHVANALSLLSAAFGRHP